jgi:predicted DNA-binding protein
MKPKPKPSVKNESFKISEEGQELLENMAKQDYMPKSRFIRKLIADEAKRRELEIPEVVKYEST